MKNSSILFPYIKSFNLPGDNDSVGGSQSVKSVEWDLSEFYSGIDDPQIEKDMAKARELADEFIDKYKGQINSPDLTAEKLLQAYEDLEEFYDVWSKFSVYSMYMHSVNTDDENVGKFYQQVGEFSNELSSGLLWFGLEWLKLDEEKAGDIIDDPLFDSRRHSLKTSRVFKPFTLEESEERILTKTAQTGPSAFGRLYDELKAGTVYEVELDGKLQELTEAEITTVINSHKNRETRKRAAGVYTAKFGEKAKIYAFILNTLLLDSKLEDELRGYDYPQHATFLGYEVNPETVEEMVSAVEKRYDISERFYRLKKKILGYDELFEWDRYNPLFPDKNAEYSWDGARDVVLKSFDGFDKRFSDTAGKFFEEKWIHAQVKKGKESGAWCSSSVPSRHPFVMMNFTGKDNDVTTLAHELGHGVHGYLAREQPYSEYRASTAVSEIASVFAEELVFEKLFEEQDDPEIKLNMLSDKIQRSFATIFRQTAFYLFETDIHNHRRNNGELKLAEFGEYYQKRLQKMFGKALTLTDDHRIWWMPVMHFYHFDFYVFTYAFGETLTNALFANYKQDKAGFADKYIEALKAGGSKDPYQLTKMMGVDINQAGFWENGLEIIEGFVDDFEELADSI